jgi:2-methylisocitrate lyase-like PEP mutase family enzyme
VTSQPDKATRFAELHNGEPFVIPNPWDVGSARVLESLGFLALTSTSSGFAYTLGRLDGQVTLDELCEHVRAICEATSVPFAVDIENGYGPSAEDAAQAIVRIAGAGAVGGSLEDWDPSGRIYAVEEAAARIAAAHDAAASLGFRFQLVARAENHIRGNPDLSDTIARLQAYEAAGADVLYAPGLASVQEIQAVCEAVSRPVNVLAWPGLSAAEIFAAGAQRISVGGALAGAAIQSFAAVAEQIRDTGEFSGLVGLGRVRDWLGG